MRKLLIFAITIFLFSLVISSCRTHKERCPAYGQNQTETLKTSAEDKI